MAKSLSHSARCRVVGLIGGRKRVRKRKINDAVSKFSPTLFVAFLEGLIK